MIAGVRCTEFIVHEAKIIRKDSWQLAVGSLQSTAESSQQPVTALSTNDYSLQLTERGDALSLSKCRSQRIWKNISHHLAACPADQRFCRVSRPPQMIVIARHEAILGYETKKQLFSRPICLNCSWILERNGKVLITGFPALPLKQS